MKPKVRRLKVGIAEVRVDARWSGSTISIQQYGPTNREVIIEIQDPSDLAYLRGKLTEIETHWRKALG